jgi:hypothetical protein
MELLKHDILSPIILPKLIIQPSSQKHLKKDIEYVGAALGILFGMVLIPKQITLDPPVLPEMDDELFDEAVVGE